jgi:hypothetical protein
MPLIDGFNQAHPSNLPIEVESLDPSQGNDLPDTSAGEINESKLELDPQTVLTSLFDDFAPENNAKKAFTGSSQQPIKILRRSSEIAKEKLRQAQAVPLPSSSAAGVSTRDPERAERNKFFEERWGKIKKSWESPEIDADGMDELHQFKQLADKAKFETVQNIADLMTFMHSMKNNPLVQKTGTFVEHMSSGRIEKKTVEKYIRTIPHILHAVLLSLDPDTKKMTEGAFRLAFTPNLVDGDEEAGKRGLETKEVRLIRDAIRKVLKDSGFDPNTGELVDKTRLKGIEDARKAAEQRQKDFFLNGFDALSVKENN